MSVHVLDRECGIRSGITASESTMCRMIRMLTGRKRFIATAAAVAVAATSAIYIGSIRCKMVHGRRGRRRSIVVAGDDSWLVFTAAITCRDVWSNCGRHVRIGVRLGMCRGAVNIRTSHVNAIHERFVGLDSTKCTVMFTARRRRRLMATASSASAAIHC